MEEYNRKKYMVMLAGGFSRLAMIAANPVQEGPLGGTGYNDRHIWKMIQLSKATVSTIRRKGLYKFKILAKRATEARIMGIGCRLLIPE